MWWKNNKWKVIVPAAVVAALALAFWYGGGSPGLRGWSVEKPPAQPPREEQRLEMPPVEPEAPKPEAPAETAPEAVARPATAVAESPSAPAEEAKPAAPEPEAPAIEAGSVEWSEAQGMELDPETGKDRYQTDPVPEGKPLPVEPQDAVVSDAAHTCTLSISCASILDHLDWLDPEKVELVPEDGWILEPVETVFYEGENVFNVLQRTCKQNRIHMEFTDTPMYNSAYIEGIHNLYEFDCGELSGWMYSVNGWYPNYGCSRYGLRDGDTVCWVYTCELGEDIGGRNSLAG